MRKVRFVQARRGVARRSVAGLLAFALLGDVCGAVPTVVATGYRSHTVRAGAAPAPSAAVAAAHLRDVNAASSLESTPGAMIDDRALPPMSVDGSVVPTSPDAQLPSLATGVESGPAVVVELPPSRKATGFDEERSVEALELRTQYSKTFLNPDGTSTIRESTAALHYRNSVGDWVEIDNRVVRGADGVLTNSANEWSVRFEPMTTGRGVSFRSPDGTVRFVAEGAAPVKPTVEPDGKSVRYRNVVPGSRPRLHRHRSWGRGVAGS